MVPIPVPDTAAFVVDLPQLDLGVHGSGQDEMGRAGEPPDDGDALAVARPGVDLSLGDEAFGRRLGGLEIDAKVLGRVEEGAALVVLQNTRTPKFNFSPIHRARKKSSKKGGYGAEIAANLSR